MQPQGRDHSLVGNVESSAKNQPVGHCELFLFLPEQIVLVILIFSYLENLYCGREMLFRFRIVSILCLS